MGEIRLPQHIVDRIERRWAAKLEQVTAMSSSRPQQARRSTSSAKKVSFVSRLGLDAPHRNIPETVLKLKLKSIGRPPILLELVCHDFEDDYWFAPKRLAELSQFNPGYLNLKKPLV